MTDNVQRHSATQAAKTTTPEVATARPAPTVAQVLASQKADQTIDQAGNITKTPNQPVPTALTTAVHATAPGLFDRDTYERNLRRDTAGGPLVSYNGKDGGYFLDKQEFNILRSFLARDDLISWGWIRFHPDTGVPELHMRSIGEGPPLERSALSDPPNVDGSDNPNWTKNDFGEITDPWQYQEILPIAALDATGAVYYLVARNWATRKALGAFRRNVADNMHHRRGLSPVIQLIDTKEFNKRRKAEVPKPIIHIVGWRNPDGSETSGAAPLVAAEKHDPKLITSGKSLLGEGMDDQIPF